MKNKGIFAMQKVLIGLTALLLTLGCGGCGFGNLLPPTVENLSIPLPDSPAQLQLKVTLQQGNLQLNAGATKGLLQGTATYNRPELKPQILAMGNVINLQQSELQKLPSEGQNAWQLQLAPVPMTLTLDLKGGHNELELGALPLGAATLRQGSGKATLSFAHPNPRRLKTLDLSLQTSTFTATNLANARAQKISFQGAGGQNHLDFGGELRQNLQVSITMALGDLLLTLPPTVTTQLNIEGQRPEVVKVRGPWQQVGNRFTLGGGGKTISITIRAGTGKLELRSR